LSIAVQPQKIDVHRCEGSSGGNKCRFRCTSLQRGAFAGEQEGMMLADQRQALLMAILASGTLDILSAFVFGGMAGVGPGQILRYVASGPFGDGMHEGGTAAAALGLGVHFALMTVMVTVYFLIADRIEAVRRHWYVAGPLYGIAIYLVMYWLVVPTRFGTEPSLDPWRVGNALFSHIVCVGLPMAYIASRAWPKSKWARS
jgi:hypothetical protein